ncbi:hypothetical protein Y88_3803 [Novosphingobium nitrogenifigens DSM 19370]|uniref:Uncharacterized protein n=1 Tax=Novosphingobium nitrogenifigens DSM 19370 TaxID=983920 RepID=F1ZD20_9SPHN|nr:hypothetical protein Y88_3803 [Novosphingobium nitrogenifigens DSM 19370]
MQCNLHDIKHQGGSGAGRKGGWASGPTVLVALPAPVAQAPPWP